MYLNLKIVLVGLNALGSRHASTIVNSVTVTWRTLISPTERWGWTPVSLKINTRHTHCSMYVYYCRTYDKAVSGGGRGKREDMC